MMDPPYWSGLYDCGHTKEDVKRIVEELVTDERGWGMEYRGGLSNHMVWVAVPMLMLGTPEPVVRHRVKRYVREKALVWKGELGSLQTQVLDDMPKLLLGICGATLHPFLHLGVAAYLSSPVLLSQALTWLRQSNLRTDTHAYQSHLHPLVASTTHDTLERVWSGTPPRRLLDRASLILQHHPMLATSQTAPPTPPAAYLTSCAALMYTTRNEFVALHGLTSSWALGVICSVYPEHATLATGAWVRNFFVLYAAAGMPFRPTFEKILLHTQRGDYACLLNLLEMPAVGGASPQWDTLYATALSNPDEHVLKALWMLRVAYDGASSCHLRTLYLAAACRLVDPRPPPVYTPVMHTHMRGIPLEHCLNELRNESRL